MAANLNPNPNPPNVNPNPNPPNINPNPNLPHGVVAAGNQAPADEPKDPRFFYLTLLQYFLIFAVTIVFVWVLASGIKTSSLDLSDMDSARGLITFVIAVTTAAIALLLVLTAIVTRDPEKRIVLGKEILAILIGVLGTIVGFYYGAAKKENAAATSTASQISAAAVKVTPPDLARDGKTTISAKLTGGVPPYRYTIIFTPDTIKAIPEKESANGDISEEIAGSEVPPGTKEIAFRIEGKDKNDVPFVINKDGKVKITVK